MTLVQFDIPVTARRGIVTVGNFDGVHCGHQQMLMTLRRIAAEAHARAVVVTFDPHPLSLLRPESPLPRLTTIPRRAELLRQYGADEVVILPVTHMLLRMTAEEFFREILRDGLDAAAVVEGPNFRFGRDREGDVDMLRRLCADAAILFRAIEAVETSGELISSSRIRQLLAEGQLSEAIRLTGHAHRITGTVTRGAGRGRSLGFPTANLAGVEVMLPGHGVYAGTTLLDETRYTVAVSIGPNPTFGEKAVKIECHLDGFAGDLYGRTLDIDLWSEIRPLLSFASAAELEKQIIEDVRQCRERAKGWS